MSKTFSPDGNCILTTSRFYMASGGPPESADVARLWDTETGTLLREWKFGYGNPDSAFFVGRDRFIVLSAGEGLIYRTSLCGSLDELNHFAMPSNSSQVSVDARVDNVGGPTVPPSRPELPPGPEIPASTQEAPASASSSQPLAVGPTVPPSRPEPLPGPEIPASTHEAPASASSSQPLAVGPTVPPSRPEPPPGPEIPASTQEAPASASSSQPLADVVKETPTPSAPSFSCGGKLSPVEVLICKDTGLAKLDVDLAQAYRKKLMDLQGQYRQQLVFEQRAWLKERAGCVNKGDLKQCVEDAFRHRRAALDSRQ